MYTNVSYHVSHLIFALKQFCQLKYLKLGLSALLNVFVHILIFKVSYHAGGNAK